MNMLAIALSLLLICFVFFFFTTRKSCSGDKGAKIPPSPPRLPILGNTLRICEKPHRSLTDLSRIYGSVWFDSMKNHDELIVINAAFRSNQRLKNEQGARTYELR
ncbi:unnamed protein product [Arabis nemorensis]|uniref:Uncharacterized protein n=1 Tax=Arabis nemorensis TaxID=586526 RepID=A0A565BYD5_9BRAS|nr:unnamed protein product [Arabis nemorensis]